MFCSCIDLSNSICCLVESCCICQFVFYFSPPILTFSVWFPFLLFSSLALSEIFPSNTEPCLLHSFVFFVFQRMFPLQLAVYHLPLLFLGHFLSHSACFLLFCFTNLLSFKDFFDYNVKLCFLWEVPDSRSSFPIFFLVPFLQNYQMVSN